MKRIVYVIEVDVEDPTEHDDTVSTVFDSNLVNWTSYFPLEDNAPIRVNISYDGVEEV